MEMRIAIILGCVVDLGTGEVNLADRSLVVYNVLGLEANCITAYFAWWPCFPVRLHQHLGLSVQQGFHL